MKRHNGKHLLFASCAMLVAAVSSAQVEAKYGFGLSAGTFIYQGDLTPTAAGSFKTPGFVLGLTGIRRLSPLLSARLDLNFGQLKGDEALYVAPAYRKQRAFAFKSSVTEISLLAEYEPLGRIRKFSPYLFGGIGLGSLNIQRDYSRFNAAYFETEPAVVQGLNEDIAHSLLRTIPILPVGVGLRYNLYEKIALQTEASYRIMSTDYLDGFSRSVNPALKDHYYHYSIGFRFSLGGRSKYDCPNVKP